MKSLQNLIDKLTSFKGTTFASLCYTNAQNEEARYTVVLGGKYSNLLEKSKAELESLIPSFTGLELEAANEVMASLNKSIEAHKNGKQNEDFTKANQYISIGNGLNINKTDLTLQLYGIVTKKEVVKEGEPKKVRKSSPLVVAKNKIRKSLSIGKLREFSITADEVEKMTLKGETFVF
jgi:hypothetical protein